MTTEEIEKLKYPIGKFDCPLDASQQKVSDWISIIEHLPNRLRNLVDNFDQKQLDTPYRPEGWTVRQVIHHIPDSHINAYIRFKWALTEENPLIKAYHEGLWAELPDSRGPVEPSLNMLESLHEKWVYLLKGMTPEKLNRTYMHPVSGENILKNVIGMYAWHGNHHFTHIQNLAKREGWI